MSNNARLLFENLFAEDLKNMLQPIISVDDFESKIDDKTIVVSFYAKNEDAAEDLSVFLERSRFEFVLDTETSTTMNKDGDYLVFVEIDTKEVSQEELSYRIIELTRLASILSGISVWKLKNNRILNKTTVPLSEKNILTLFAKIKEYELQKEE